MTMMVTTPRRDRKEAHRSTIARMRTWLWERVIVVVVVKRTLGERVSCCSMASTGHFTEYE